MTIGQTKRVEAIHPHWTGHLLLSGTDESVTHEGLGTLGRYEFLDGNLIVHWNDFGDDVFIHLKDKYVHKTIIERSPDLGRFCTVMFEGRNLLASQIKVFVPESFYEVWLRLLTSDLPIFNQVFLQSDYNSRHLPESASSIVDLGANIGLSTVFFALKYPQARILSVEPDPGNFSLLLTNTAALGSRIQTEEAAVWTEDGMVSLHTEDSSGRPLGHWGAQVSCSSGQYQVAAYRLSTLLQKVGMEAVDILKVDIEGAEVELFEADSSGWLSRTKLILIETHDRFRAGAERVVRTALEGQFEELDRSGECLVFRKKSG